MVNTEIYERLKSHNLTFAWLINRLEMEGVLTDKSEVSSVMSGTRRGPKADLIIEKSNEILDKYDAYINESN